ncbi:AMP-dependent synthetase/ligase [Rhodococcus qingshengii]|uniref:Acyl-CoA synthetase n=1 Tax=Rhodococcus erythropolis TaxID=1833 RepID=A0A6G9CWP4_RHOER|nr:MULTISPECIES: long-chain fatty acid--CoA ligase [Rhodococcus]NHE68528.1 long-chain fatty acid--CoA ligase [Rhodococcus sp. D-46]MCT6736156.1 long-chain fatty acid--CoA ligase [Rhodococcus qingshengii]MDJ0434816.1 long-chain fatty acid--CoA ligase [Rhodococcus qingshengii]QIP41475.1 long-chain fatty acid--CoA ligase [Rhodococcus erythropolis]UEL31390.1 long-chain fatty acid--CoA ligase [Rhodococcus sp. C1]
MSEYSAKAQFTISDNESVVHTVFTHAERTPDLTVFSRPKGEGWVDVTAKEFAEQVTGVANGLIAAGVQAGDRVALLSATRYEWTLFDFAIWAAGAATVPIYDSSSQGQVSWILEDSEAVIAIVETGAHEQLFQDAPSSLKAVMQIDDGAVEKLTAQGADVDDTELKKRLAGIKADDLASLVYTSGTTGRPKGCILTHRNFLSEVRGILTASIGKVAVPGNRVLTFLPLAHVLARAVSLATFEAGASQAHWSDFATITTQFERYKPNTILGVPRVFEKVRDGAARKAESGGKIPGAIFAFAEVTAKEYSQALDKGGPSLILKAKHAVADKLVYSKLREALGGECWFAISGGGALTPELGHFFRGLGVPIYEGYGLTETTAAHCVNVPGAQKIGTVGQPMGGNGVRIAEDGEIELNGGVVFKGYWKNDKATEETFVNGWMRTGDLGELDSEGYLSITGRKKDLLVTAGGKNVSPGPMEDRIRSHSIVSQAVVVGDGKTYITALLTVDPEVFEKWKAENGKPSGATVAELRDDKDLRAELQKAVDDANAAVSHAESIKKFVILDRDLTEEDGEMTATLKIKRNVVVDRFSKEIEGMYAKS